MEKLLAASQAVQTLEAAVAGRLGRPVSITAAEQGATPAPQTGSGAGSAAAPARPAAVRLTPEMVKKQRLATLSEEDPVLGRADENWDLELLDEPTAGPALRCSTIEHRSWTTSMPASASCRAAASFRMPSWNHTAFGRFAMMSSTCAGMSAGRRKTTTTSSSLLDHLLNHSTAGICIGHGEHNWPIPYFQSS
jgi:hypothetical protein